MSDDFPVRSTAQVSGLCPATLTVRRLDPAHPALA
jgi:hypothetical protein